MMDPITIAMIATSVGMPLVGEIFGSGNDAKANQLREEALAEYMGISVPELRELAPHLIDRTNLENVSTDPRFDSAQDESMGRLQEIGRSGGLDARARGRMEEARLEAGSQAKADRDAVLNSARARGTVGTGEELTAQLQADQAASNRERMAGVQGLSDAEQRALEAISGAGAMAGQRQAQQFNQRATVATAQDRIDEFNAQTANDFAQYNQQQQQQHFNNEMDLANARAGVRLGNANQQQQQGERDRQRWGGIGQGATYGLAGYQQAGMAGGAPRAAPAGAATAQRPVAPGAQPATMTPQQQKTRRKVG